MYATLKNYVRLPSLATVAIVLLALFVGLVVPFYAGMVAGGSGTLARMAALPALLLLLILLIYDRKKLLLAILLFRSMGDIFLESTRFGVIGVGGLINLAVIMIAVLLMFEQPKQFPRKDASIWWPFLLILAGSLMISPELGDAIKLYLGLLSSIAVFLAAAYMVRTPADFNRMVKLVIWSSVVPTIYALVDAALHARGTSFRLSGTFSHANILAFYLMLVISMTLYALKTPNFGLRLPGRICLTGYMLLLLVQLLLTQTRSAWMACILVFLGYALLFERKYLFYFLLLPIVAITVPSVRERLLDLEKGNEVVRYAQLNSFAWRVMLWEKAIAWMEPLRMVFGYGIDGFRHYSLVFFEANGGTKWSAHNVYVQFLFDIGVVGVIAYLSVFWRLVLRFKTYLVRDRLLTYILIMLVIEYVVICFSDNVFAYLVFNWYFWFIMGAGCALVRHQMAVKDEPATVVPA